VLVFLWILGHLKEGASMPFSLFSKDFKPGDMISPKFTCEGDNLSPALTWGDPPLKTASFALICDDPDAPRKTWVHWVIYGIPAEARGLPQGVEKSRELADGSRQGPNDSGQTGYSGPCPPPGHGPHRYFFRLYALDLKLDLAPGATKEAVMAAIQGHILGQAEVMGRYERKAR
jgi:Raf kinase inhibitor-like YbhB/YbcL family protein